MQDMERFGPKLKAALRAKSWNQSDLARAVGIGRDSISTYIAGTVKPTPKNLAKIASALGVSPGDLMPGAATRPNVEEPILEMRQQPDGSVMLHILKSVTLEQAVEIFSILKK